MRIVVLALALIASPAAAPAQPSPGIAQVSRMLSALWRPLPPAEGRGPEAIFAAACEGALDEMRTVDAATPASITAESLRAIRAPRGLIIVPAADNPAHAFVFANAELADITSGPAILALVDPAQGRVDITDAGGRVTALQLGVAESRPLMRIVRQGGEPLVYVGCAATSS